jgi:hypothetical protein
MFQKKIQGISIIKHLKIVHVCLVKHRDNFTSTFTEFIQGYVEKYISLAIATLFNYNSLSNHDMVHTQPSQNLPTSGILLEAEKFLPTAIPVFTESR